MQFIKKNYEKLLLGLVLLGLVVVAVFLVLMVGSEKDKQEERRTKNLSRSVKPLPAVETTLADAFLKRAEAPAPWNFSDNTHKLFNPVRWQKTADNRVIKNPAGWDLQKVEITKITPLYFTVALNSINISDSGARYEIVIEQQAATKPNFRIKRSTFVSKGEKKEYGEKKDTFTLRDVVGPPENPTELILDFSDLDKPISISKEKPFQKVDGYMADMKFAPENRTFMGRRKDDRITIAGEDYNIVAISENEVVLSAKSNQKKWTIKYNAAP
jgi:hypothetical protein